MDAVEPIMVYCPYCGEAFETMADWSGGSQQYTEDCAVCCRPIVFRLDTDSDTRSVNVAREDE
ncbi:MAG: CPXCG motif-containing cysteine-rich protein [Acidiferrobacteraceae bacterium]